MMTAKTVARQLSPIAIGTPPDPWDDDMIFESRDDGEPEDDGECPYSTGPNED